jgi:poly(A) polymerase
MPHNEVLDLARRVAMRLREHGYESWLVGGCVRDLLLRREPMDCDVSTSAHPDRIQELFPGAMLVGAHFGVVLVKYERAQVEVATFRSDGHYSDGRRPDRVTFETDVKKDLMRRDFTINALLMDPATSEIHDFVGGRADLDARLIRAIGNPRERFREDHLRMMRAVRFAARFGFAIESGTWEAIREEKESIVRISIERITAELARILTEGGAAVGMAMLRECGLLDFILPEAGSFEILARLRSPGFEQALASVLLEANSEMECLRLSNDERDRVLAFIDNHPSFGRLHEMSVSERKRFLRMNGFDQQLELYRAAVAGDSRYEYVRSLRDSMTDEMLWPRRLLTGDDLKELGVPAGPRFAELLTALEDAQLEGKIGTRAEAEALVKEAFSGGSSI